MARFLTLLIIGLVIAACAPAVDRCTADPALPDCQAARASANATIAAIDSERAVTNREATRQAKASESEAVARATQAAAGAKATQIAVNAFSTKAAGDAQAQATKNAIEIQAMTQTLMVSATIAAINVDTARVKAQVELSTTALIGQADVDRSTAQSQAAGPQSWLTILVGAAAVIALVVTAVYGFNRVTLSITAAADSRANQVRYGYNNERVAYRIRLPDGRVEFIPLDQILGHSNQYLDALNVPDLTKLAATVEADKRTKLVLLARPGTGLPVLSRNDDAERPGPQLAATDQIAVSGGVVTRIPTFAELLRDWRPTQDRLLFGYAETGPLYGRIDQLLSVEIIGRQGQGKTTLLRLIYAQCLIIGVQVLVWDLHEDIVEDLPGAQSYTSAGAIEQSAIALQVELDRRIAEHDKTGVPIMVLIDEINQLVNVVPIISQVIGRVVNEGRKYHVFCIISAKGIPATLFGGSTVRDAFSSRYAFNTTTRQAAMIGFDREAVPAVRDLTPGRALFDGPFPVQVITVPNTTPADVKSILALSGGYNGNPETRKVLSQRRSGNFRAETETETDDAGNPPEIDAETVAAMRSEGLSTTQIIAQLWGATTGRRYLSARAELARLERVQ